MAAQARMNAHVTMGRKNKCKLNFFSMCFVQNNEDIHFSSKNSEKWRTQALNNREQQVQISNILRFENTLIAGGPQGSTDEHLLFSLFINDLVFFIQ